MIDSSEKRNRQLALELQNSHVCEKRSNAHSLKRSVQVATTLWIRADVVAYESFYNPNPSWG